MIKILIHFYLKILCELIVLGTYLMFVIYYVTDICFNQKNN